MTRNEALAEAIKNLEPNIRIKGLTPDWNRFMMQFNSGMYSDPALVPLAEENSVGEKNSGLDNSQEL